MPLLLRNSRPAPRRLELVNFLFIFFLAAIAFTGLSPGNAAAAGASHTIMASAGPGGSISPAGTVVVADGTNQTFTISPNAGKRILDVLIDGNSWGAVGSYTFTSVASNHTIHALFTDASNFIIYAQPSAGGTLSPVTAVAVAPGANITFNILPDAGYRILEVLIDDITYGTISSYTFTNVTADHTISATFTNAANFIICPTYGSNGYISPSSAVAVAPGGSQNFAISPYPYFRILDVLVDGVSLGPSTSGYNFTNVLADHTITAYFTNSYNSVIWATAGAGGTISPYGGVEAPYGSSHTFNIAANAGYQIANVLVNSASVGAVSSYSFTYPYYSGDQTISATFALIVHTITATAGPGGSISPAGTVSVTDGSSQTFNFYPNTGYQVADVVVDGTTHLGSVSSYTFNGVTADHTINVTFAVSACTIAASAGAGGTISPSGAVLVAYGASQTFSVTPNTGYHISDVQVDGSSVGPVSSYPFTYVTSNHTISASFAINTYTITASAGPGGSISPTSATVNYGGSQTFSIIPNTGYHITDVQVDGSSVGAVNSYSFTNVIASHTITASFSAVTCTITASAGAGGSISPAGTVLVGYGASQGFIITPGNGYHVADVKVDGSSVGARTSYTFTNITTDHTIAASFAISLAFPLRGYTSTNAPVSAVMDNSVLERTPIKFYVPGDVIKAFNGETGEKQYGVKYLDPYGKYWPAYKNSAGTDFFPPSGAGVRPLNYLNGAYLSYAGNPGYNYQVPEGTPVLATADGKLYKAVTDPVNGAGYSYYYNSYINHQNGFYSWYLYAPLNADILAQINQNGYAQVTRGQVIGKTIGDRLHFEVRQNGFDHQNVVDPYKLGLWLQETTRRPLPSILLLLQD